MASTDLVVGNALKRGTKLRGFIIPADRSLGVASWWDFSEKPIQIKMIPRDHFPMTAVLAKCRSGQVT